MVTDIDLIASDDSPFDRWVVMAVRSVRAERDRTRMLLELRTEALGRVQRERDAYREAIRRVIALETHEAGESGTDWLDRDEVHDAIGSDIIASIAYRP
jgi:hypothetical protein